VTDRQEYKVTALRQGTVIDHLPPGMAIKALEVLGHGGDGVVTMGMYLSSKKWGKKDIIKIENKELTAREVATLALLGPHTTISIIRDFKVVEKIPIAIPEEIVAVLRCPNPSCITNHDAVSTTFLVDTPEPLVVRCRYCERKVGKDELVLI